MLIAEALAFGAGLLLHLKITMGGDENCIFFLLDTDKVLILNLI